MGTQTKQNITLNLLPRVHGKVKNISCYCSFKISREISTIMGRTPLSWSHIPFLAAVSAPPFSRIWHRRPLDACSTERRKTKRGSDSLGEESWNQLRQQPKKDWASFKIFIRFISIININRPEDSSYIPNTRYIHQKQNNKFSPSILSVQTTTSTLFKAIYGEYRKKLVFMLLFTLKCADKRSQKRGPCTLCKPRTVPLNLKK